MSSQTEYEKLKQKFINGELPAKGESNDYFHQAAIQCKDEGLTMEVAVKNILVVYKKWEQSPTFSKRPWSNIEEKIIGVYK